MKWQLTRFLLDSMVQCYHKYQSIWEYPLADENLPYEWEMGNSLNLQSGYGYQGD